MSLATLADTFTAYRTVAFTAASAIAVVKQDENLSESNLAEAMDVIAVTTSNGTKGVDGATLALDFDIYSTWAN